VQASEESGVPLLRLAGLGGFDGLLDGEDEGVELGAGQGGP
jgi:hypothetical protein